MAGYIQVPFVDDPDQLVAESLDHMAELTPGWEPRDGNVEVWLIQTLARLVAEARTVAAQVPVAIFRYFGTALLDLPPVAASTGTLDTTWTVVDGQGYTIPAGTAVAVARTGDDLVAFETVDAHAIPPGQTTITSVPVAAREPGADTNGLGPGPMVLVDALAYVDAVVATSVSTGGVDAEPDEVYLDRLADRLELLAPRPILPGDFATMARQVPGVARAVAIDLYDPDTGTYDNERTVTVAAVDGAGQPIGSVIKDDLATLLEAAREANFVVHVIDPIYVPIVVTFTAVAFREADPDEVTAAAQQAVRDLLDPGRWGTTPRDTARWERHTVVRYLEVAAALDRVDGLDYITALTVNGGTVDVPLTGPAPLPAPFAGVDSPSSVTGTVVAP